MLQHPGLQRDKGKVGAPPECISKLVIKIPKSNTLFVNCPNHIPAQCWLPRCDRLMSAIRDWKA